MFDKVFNLKIFKSNLNFLIMIKWWNINILNKSNELNLLNAFKKI